MTAENSLETHAPRGAADRSRRGLARIKDDAGLIALGFFGIGLIAAGAGYVLQSRFDSLDYCAAAAIGAPGLAALAMAMYGLWRMPAPVECND